jgi:hypothetical protein
VEISEGMSGDIRGDEWRYLKGSVETSEGMGGNI